ncbi:hypothetical protein Tco_0366957 [Tanacetum coccineum]
MDVWISANREEEKEFLFDHFLHSIVFVNASAFNRSIGFDNPIQGSESNPFEHPFNGQFVLRIIGSKASRLESLKQKKQAVTGEGSSATHNKHYANSDIDRDATLYSSSSDKIEESANETDDADESNMDLSDDNLNGDHDAAGYGVFMHNKSTATPNSTYLSPTVTSSSLDFIQTLLDETPANELTDFMSHLVYTDAQTTSMVHNLEGNPELTCYISGASKVPLGTHIDVIATKTLMQEMF